MNLYDMKLFDSFWNSSINCNIIRVPGGWIFQTTDSSQSSVSAMSFVPFNNEFIEATNKQSCPKCGVSLSVTEYRTGECHSCRSAISA
jgi:hypothetical protein